VSNVPDTLTVAQAAEAIHRHPRFVRDLITSGKLNAVRLTERGHWLVFTDSLSALLGVRPQRQHSPEYLLRKDLEILERRGIR
jgi:excisionase family DNA binding protein